MVRILAQDHDANGLERRKAQRVENLLVSRITRAGGPFSREIAAQLNEIRLVEFFADDRHPGSGKFHLGPASAYLEVCVRKAQWQCNQNVLPTTSANFLMRVMSSAYLWGSRACGPSERAFSGQL